MITNENSLAPSVNRRAFIETGLKLAMGTGLLTFGLEGCNKEEEEEEQKVSPPEDLMQEHGLLNRVLLIYDACRSRLSIRQSFDKNALFDSATIVRSFIEDYHEKQEEEDLFPRFKKANKLVGLVDVLLQQHQAGRTITDQLLQLSKIRTLSDNETQQMIKLLSQFNAMYRPHEAREDTVLFPAFRKIISKHEYDALGEKFEKREQELFGKDGFEKMVEKVAVIEMKLGIYELTKFTPVV